MKLISHRFDRQKKVREFLENVDVAFELVRGLSKKYSTLNFPCSSDARAAPLCTEEGNSLMRILEIFLRVRVCQSLPAGRRVRRCYTCSSDLGFLSR